MAFTKITNAGFGLTTGTLVGVAASFSSTVSVGGTLTYEDVTNVDSVGLITARNGIEVTDKGVQVGTGATVDSAADNTLTFLTNGSERLRINSDGLVTVGGNETVSSATGVQIENAGAALLTLLRNDATISDGNTLGGIDFYGNDGGTVQQVAKISAVADGTHGNNDKPTRLVFSTTADGGSSATERARIDSSGNFGLGTTSAGALLHIESNSADAAKLRLGFDSTRYYDIFRKSSDGSGDLYFYGSQSGYNGFVFDTVDGERMRIDTSGRLLLGTTTEGQVSADDFTVSGSGDSGITIRSGSSSEGSIMFSDATSGTGEYAGWINYNHGSNFMRFFTNATERLRITSAGVIQCGTSSVLKAEINNSVSGHQFISQCSDNNNGFEIYQQHGSNTTRNNFAVYGNTGSSGAKELQFLVRGDGKTGVGDVSPNSNLHVKGGSESTDNLLLTLQSDGVANDGSLSTGLRLINSTSDSSVHGGEIRAIRTSSSAADLTLSTYNGSSIAEALRIDSDGKLLIGTTTSKEGTSKLQCVSASDATIFVGSTNVSASGQAKINFAPSNGIAGGQIICVAEEDFSVGANRTGYLKFVTRKDGTLSDRMYLSSQGDLRIGGNSNLGSQLLQVQGGSNATSDVIIANSVASTGQTATLTLAPANNVTGGRITCVAEEDFSSGANRTARLELYTRKDGTLSERVRISSDGYLKASNTGSYLSNVSYHEFNQSNNEQMLFTRVTNTSYTENMIITRCSTAASSAYTFLLAQSSNGSDSEFNLRGDGNGYADGSWNGGGADYAEFFEWSDGNASAQDRRGISVVLDGDKIRESVAGEEPIGVISGNPSVVGDADIERWKGKYLRDDYGTYIQEDYEVEGDDGNTIVQQRRKLNPDYNPDTEYVSRENRPEWDCVGLMGKLRIRKGQITGSRWIKMRDVSDTVEEWLVR